MIWYGKNKEINEKINKLQDMIQKICPHLEVKEDPWPLNYKHPTFICLNCGKQVYLWELNKNTKIKGEDIFLTVKEYKKKRGIK